MKRVFCLCLFFCGVAVAQTTRVERVEPPNWWLGMEYSELDLLLYGKNIAAFDPTVRGGEVLLKEVKKVDNPNYLFLTLDVSKAPVGRFDIVLRRANAVDIVQPYEIKPRSVHSKHRKGFDSSDVVYLITPDRFANGNPKNDAYGELREKSIDREDDYARHGGDIQGITEHMEYIKQMGFTAVWLSPVLINDMPEQSYHGYAITDFYKVDPRFGTLEDYKRLVEVASKKGIKVIMDQVANHFGLGHWWIGDLPSEDWVNYFENLEGKNLHYSSHRRTVNQDTYAATTDKKSMQEGWFVSTMPDLNHRNEHVAKYIIQNSIWWIETLGIQGIRQDTYPYPDKHFMSRWASAIMREYPNFNIVGEEWSYNPLIVGYWQQGANNKDGYQSHLKSVMDFPMQGTIVKGLLEKENPNAGLVRIYEGLANDFHYQSPKDLMIFLDNHDMDRLFTQVRENIIIAQMAIAYSLVLPRIPQIYYGTEILMENTKKPHDHGYIRKDMPGGWESDKINVFTGQGLSRQQTEMQNYLRNLLRYRKSSKAIHQGKTVHFVPQNNVYVLFRVYKDESVVCILNQNKEPFTLDLRRFEQMGLDGQKMKNVVSGQTFTWKDSLQLDGQGSVILSTKQ